MNGNAAKPSAIKTGMRIVTDKSKATKASLDRLYRGVAAGLKVFARGGRYNTEG